MTTRTKLFGISAVALILMACATTATSPSATSAAVPTIATAVAATNAATAAHAATPSQKATDSGARQGIDHFYAVAPTCEIEGYPEMKVLTPPSHGEISSSKGQTYPNFNKDNVRYVCNARLVGSTQIFYQSAPDFHGKDALTIEIRFPATSEARIVSYSVDVF
jgi:hypothetical protein